MTLEEEYLEFVKQFKFEGGWPTNLEFFQAVCKWQREQIKSYLENVRFELPEHLVEELFNEHET